MSERFSKEAAFKRETHARPSIFRLSTADVGMWGACGRSQVGTPSTVEQPRGKERMAACARSSCLGKAILHASSFSTYSLSRALHAHVSTLRRLRSARVHARRRREACKDTHMRAAINALRSFSQSVKASNLRMAPGVVLTA